MIFLRLACLLAGVLVLVAPPAVLFPNGALASDLAGAAATPLLLLLAASGFFFIALAGHRLKRSPALLRLSVLLLAAPFLVGVGALWFGTEPAALWMSAALIAFTLVIGLVLVFPFLKGPSARRLRARDGRRRREPVLVQG